MPYRLERHEHISIVRWQGCFDLAAGRQVIHLLWSDGQFTNPYVLLDWRAGENGLRSGDLTLIADFMRRFMHQRHYGRIAYLVRPEYVAMAHWMRRAMHGAPFELKVFTDEEPALEWLEAFLA
ncbi:MAG: STAS/SEC14 domain-containing protein [Planctomycetota bacterium]